MAEWAFVHDDRATTAERLERVLRERIRPATHRVVGRLDVAAWHVAGEPVPPAEALRADYAPFPLGGAWGPPWGTTWFHLTGEAPAGAASTGDGLELLVDLGWTDRLPGFQAEGSRPPPRRHRGEGAQPAQRLDPGRARARSTSTSRRPPTRWCSATPASCPRRAATGRPRATSRSTGWPAPDVVVRDAAVAELVHDLEVLDGLAARAGAGRPARLGDRARAGAGAGRARPRRRAGHRRRGAGRARRDALAAPAHASAHRLSAVGHAHIDSAWLWPLRETVRKVARTTANVVDLLDTHADLVYAMSSAQQYAWLEEHRPDVFARVAAHVAVRPVRAGRRDVGGVGHQPARRRGAGPPVRPRQALLPGEVRRRDPRGVAAGLVRLLGGAAPDRPARRRALVPDPEDLLEPDQPLPAPHVLVGGHRRHPGVHPLPAGRHLQRRAVRRASWPTPCAPSATRAPRPGRWCRSGTATAAAARPARCWPAPAAPPTSRARRGSRSSRRRRSSPRPRRSTARRRRCGSASCTWSCTAPRTPRRRR